MSTEVVSIRGVDPIRRALSRVTEPELTRSIDKSTRAAAGLYAKQLRAAVRPSSKRMARAVRVKRAKTGRPGWVVGGRRKTAFFWPWVIGGTAAHGPRKARAMVWTGPGGKAIVAHRVRGVKGTDAVEAVARGGEAAAFALAESTFTKEAGL